MWQGMVSKAKAGRTSTCLKGAQRRPALYVKYWRVHTSAFMCTNTHTANLFNISPHSCRDYMRWDKIDHIRQIFEWTVLYFIFSLVALNQTRCLLFLKTFLVSDDYACIQKNTRNTKSKLVQALYSIFGLLITRLGTVRILCDKLKVSLRTD